MKFKVGDLVVLSAAGKRVDQNSYAVGGWDNTRSVRFKPYELKFFKKTS